MFQSFDIIYINLDLFHHIVHIYLCRRKHNILNIHYHSYQRIPVKGED